MNNTYNVYVKVDTNNNIIVINSSAFITDTTGWTQIDEGYGDKYHHAQGNYFDKGIITNSGIYRYKLVNNIPVEKTADQIASEEASIPTPPPSLEEQNRADLDYMAVILGVQL
jgi:hypothetical protein